VVAPAGGFVDALGGDLGGLARELGSAVEVARRLLPRRLGQLARLLRGFLGQPRGPLGRLLGVFADLAQRVVDDDLHLVCGRHAPMVAPREDACVDEKPQPAPDDLRRRLDKVFGDVLPDVTRDERDDRPPSNDEALLDDRPPHHDRG
jgi:hypothetical protein